MGATPAWAAKVVSASPQGEVARVRQVVLKFDEPMTGFGDPRATAPATVRCEDAKAAAPASGASTGGRWLNEKEWVHDFAADLAPGVRCTVQLRSGLQSAKGQPLTGASQWSFHTGGPFVQSIRPAEDSQIDEQQFFALRLNGPATPASVTQNVWCAVEGLGERVPVRLIEGDARAQVLESMRWTRDAQREPQRFVTLACNRRLTPDTRVQLVYGRGVATPSGVANSTEKRFDFRVREPFELNVSCERENAQAGCLPMRPVRVSFNAPVTRRVAEGLRLVTTAGASKSYAPEPAEADEAKDADAVVESVRFAAPFPEQAQLRLEVPGGFVDASGRSARNAGQFPLAVAIGAYPPLAKFAASPFGIVERLAEPDGIALLPVTLRSVEADLRVLGAQVRTHAPSSDAQIIAWLRKVERWEHGSVSRQQAQRDGIRNLPRPLKDRPESKDEVEARSVSLLDGLSDVQTLTLPRAAQTGSRPFEVVGIPLPAGFHVVEIASPRLGQGLLAAGYGPSRTMYVRTTALVTNLAVHFKRGRENALAFVTTLDQAKPVSGATVQVSDCRGRLRATGTSDASGLVQFRDLPARAPACAWDDEPDGKAPADEAQDGSDGAWFVSARAADVKGVQDLAFTWSDWHRGIEPWRFDLPTNREPTPSLRAHTVLDRSLVRAGETVSMKHLLRTQTQSGFAVPEDAARPVEMVVTHVGSGQQSTRPISWRRTASGGLSAENTLAIPAAAKLGLYQIELRGGSGSSMESGQFRVEEFRLPVLQGQIRVAATAGGSAGGSASAAPSASTAKATAPATELIQASRVPVSVQVHYLSGGPAAGLPVRVSAIARERSVHFPDFEGFSFAPPQPERPAGADAHGNEDEDEDSGHTPSADHKVVADKLPLTLDAQGAGALTIPDIPPSPQPRQLLLEAQYADPNGEVQTVQGTATLWPAAVVAGIRTEGWVSMGGPGKQSMRFQALALDLAGKPKAGVPIEVQARARITTTSRKRMVGGFYSYDSRTEVKDLGTVCRGQSDARGLLLCETALKEAGEIELVVHAKDPQGHIARAASSVWVTRQGELWFGGSESDRIDVLPEKKEYQPGETARLQVRMPFRHATALVAVEREGVVQTQVMELDGQDPTVSLKVDAAWGPNVYVSVLALRGRLREVPWYSFFTWGWKAPREWWNVFWHEGREYVAPTTLVDLSKPAFRFGVTAIRVGTQAHRLGVKVTSDQPTYPVRGTAKVTVQVTLPDGKPAAGAEVALAAVDEALLELSPNPSWQLLESMLQPRDWGVETATAQMEIIGRRHYGRKAVPAGGGGGGGSPTRELFDTLLLWKPAVRLDAQGMARIDVPLNDSLTGFRIVAIADAAAGLFGTGAVTVRTTQDLQLISGLPPLVRTHDAFEAMVTLRNTSAQPMTVQITPRATLLELAPQTVELAAGQSRVLNWPVTVPAALAATRNGALMWEIQARDLKGGASDAIKLTQRVQSAVPLTVQQATLVQLDGPYALDVKAPADALPQSGPKRGGIALALQPRLADGMPGVREWWSAYPYACLEQKASRAIGMRDLQQWVKLVEQLPSYLDADGLASYFPPRDGDANRGSDTLTSYLLAAAHEASGIAASYALPESVRSRMTQGLAAFVEGRIQREAWAPRRDLDVRKLAAIEALSRYRLATPAMLQSVTIAPDQWPTHAVIDWLQILRRVPAIAGRDTSIDKAQQVLRARLSFQGTKLVFSTEKDDHWWWLMANADTNAARLMLAVIDDPAWKDEMGRMASGLIARQQRGAWSTTTANFWGAMAIERFSRTFESAAVTGVTQAGWRDASAPGVRIDWAAPAGVSGTLGTAASSAVAGGAGPASAAPAASVADAAPAARIASGTPTATSASGASEARSAPSTSAASSAPTGSGTDGFGDLLPRVSPATRTALLHWPANGEGALQVRHDGSGKPWLTLQSLAAVPVKTPFDAGYRIRRSVTPVEQAVSGRHTRGDVLRVTLEIEAAADMTWVAVTDPIPAGATILGSGLGRDSQIAAGGERRTGSAWPAFEERAFDAFRAYYEFLPKGRVSLQYTLRLNNAGQFSTPPVRVEALYAPEMFGVSPQPTWKVEASR